MINMLLWYMLQVAASFAELCCHHVILNQDSGSLEIINSKSKQYSPKKLSAGEGSIFLILCQVACAPVRAVVIIDEPELHLEQAKSVHLCTVLERMRPDVFFVYLTHQLAIASRPVSRCIHVKSFRARGLFVLLLTFFFSSLMLVVCREEKNGR
jgi:ABC-type ATPase involved in cell division